MILGGTDDTRFELEVVGYQFPHMEHDEYGYDANWLNIRLSVRCPGNAWTTIDPCLFTWEVARLARWFEAIAADSTVEFEEIFTEPTVRFALIEANPKKLRVYFWPGWAPSDGASTDDVYIECNASSEALRTAAASLRAQLQQFPIRAGADESWGRR